MNADIVLKNASLMLPGGQQVEADLAICDGRVAAWANQIDVAAREEIDVNGSAVIPGIIDPHVHLGIFGDLRTEAATESRSGLASGITTIGCYVGGPNPHLTSIPAWRETVSDELYTDCFVHPVIGTERQLNEMPQAVERLGVRSFKVYMTGIPGLLDSVDDGFLLDVFRSSANCPIPPRICIHAENPQIIERATARLGAQVTSQYGTLLDWENTHPGVCEAEAVTRALFLAEMMETLVYFVHVSSHETVAVLRGRKPVYAAAETTSPYLTLTANERDGVLGKMVPPLRQPEDQSALWSAIEAGVIDTIGTDNTTLTRAEKGVDQSVWKAMPGYPVLGTHLPALIEEGVHQRNLPLAKLVPLLTEAPARIFGLYPRKGALLPGSDADVVVLDLDHPRRVRAEDLGSRSDFSLYDGRSLRGWPRLVIKGGRVVVRDAVLDPAAKGTGKLL